MKKQFEEAVWHGEVLEQKLAHVRAEKDELEEKFMATILEIQQKNNLKQLVLEKKLEHLTGATEVMTKNKATEQAISSYQLNEDDLRSSCNETKVIILSGLIRKKLKKIKFHLIDYLATPLICMMLMVK